MGRHCPKHPLAFQLLRDPPRRSELCCLAHQESLGDTCEENAEGTISFQQGNGSLRTLCRRPGDAPLLTCEPVSGECVLCEALWQPGCISPGKPRHQFCSLHSMIWRGWQALLPLC